MQLPFWVLQKPAGSSQHAQDKEKKDQIKEQRKVAYIAVGPPGHHGNIVEKKPNPQFCLRRETDEWVSCVFNDLAFLQLPEELIYPLHDNEHWGGMAVHCECLVAAKEKGE